MIEVIDVYKKFGNQTILNGVNLKVEKGQTLALIGGSGKGKSVFLKHMIGLLKPDAGKILIAGQEIAQLHGPKLKALKDRLGIVFQFGALFDSLTVFENVAFPLQEKTKLKEKEIREKVFHELETVGLKDDADKYPAQISGGMRKRVALARCLIMNPDVVFFDEPTTGLDPVIAQSIYKIIQTLHRTRNLTALIVSHEIPGIFKIVDQVAMLHDGKIIFKGTPNEIQASANPFVQQFLHGELE
ncbi:MAG: ABC transporter ATP-binding protein [Candidatus Omnitrophica bacterium]|nr:ABC transporter ATP-binding protein [Candidatus Omnitrophota bacterium]MCB9747839.1 ABC transporter ATP-binding protein [Candidatus Omnitrophota bacterium]